jgi:hypothetical protein
MLNIYSTWNVTSQNTSIEVMISSDITESNIYKLHVWAVRNENETDEYKEKHDENTVLFCLDHFHANHSDQMQR